MNITIIGGGTAGWLAALIISKTYPGAHKVNVVESSKIGIIGAGEGSTGTLTNIIQNITGKYDCDEQDFVNSCDVTPKLGIEHKNWSGDGTSYFGPIDGSWTSDTPLDYCFMHTIANCPKEQWHLNSDDGWLIENSKDTLCVTDGPQAYHFDGHKVGKYFKKVCGDAVTHIDSEIDDVILNDQGDISSVKLSNGSIVESDFFIDASGFNRVLMNKLDVKWHSYKENLPVDRAMPFLLKYDEDESIKPVTTAWALNYGWMWQIPLVTRKGCGYVYSSKFITDEEAQQEVESVLGKKISPIKFIKFESGRLEKLWNRNCMAVGLAAAFAEPLEATSIHTTIVQLEMFVHSFLKSTKEETCVDSRRDWYNQRISFMYDLIKDFLVLHYQSGRKDTEFWKQVTNEENLPTHTKAMMDLCKHRVPNSSMFPGIPGAAGWPLWSYILSGTGNLSPEVAKQELELHRVSEYAKTQYDQQVELIKEKIKDLPNNTDQIKQRMSNVV